MPSFNKVVLMGNLTRDPQLKHLPNNLVVAEFGIACNRRYRTAAGEDKQEVAFVDCTAFGRQAETIGQYCTKGKPIFVEGRLKYDSWEDKSGHGKRSKLTVTVENFQFIGAKGETDIPPDMFASSSNGAEPRRSDRSSADARVGKPADGWNGELPPEAIRKRKRGGTAQQPFGEEKQFEEADIPF
jgi:single-strand DNA-binding protein